MAVVTVEISAVRKTFGPTVALGGANLRAYEGEVHAIVGGNGSGKSTLAKVMSGVLIPDSGQVSILGKSASTPVEAKALGIANVYQEVLVADECSVLDNLFLGSDNLFNANIGNNDKIEKAEKLLYELLGFDLDVSTPVGELPLSLKQWITIARALLTDPKVLILDESSAALDFDSTERLFKKVREMKAKGCSIFIVTHRIAELVRIADRATVLRDGVDVGALAKEEITEARILELIAGTERGKTASSQQVAEKKGDRAVVRVDNARVWHDGGKINFSLYPGEIVGVTGLDGQGQADFVRCLAGVQQLISGKINMFDGIGTEEVNDLATAKEHLVSYVSGDRKKEGIFPNLSIFENLLMPIYHASRLGGWLNFVNRSKLQPVFKWETDKLAVKMGSQDNLITSLSGGNQQKVLLARWLVAKDTNVLLLDEPTKGVDVGARGEILRQIIQLAQTGVAVIIASSDLDEVAQIAHRVLVLREGHLVAEISHPITEAEILRHCYGHANETVA